MCASLNTLKQQQKTQEMCRIERGVFWGCVFLFVCFSLVPLFSFPLVASCLSFPLPHTHVPPCPAPSPCGGSGSGLAVCVCPFLFARRREVLLRLKMSVPPPPPTDTHTHTIHHPPCTMHYPPSTTLWWSWFGSCCVRVPLAQVGGSVGGWMDETKKEESLPTAHTPTHPHTHTHTHTHTPTHTHTHARARAIKTASNHYDSKHLETPTIMQRFATLLLAAAFAGSASADPIISYPDFGHGPKSGQTASVSTQGYGHGLNWRATLPCFLLGSRPSVPP